MEPVRLSFDGVTMGRIAGVCECCGRQHTVMLCAAAGWSQNRVIAGLSSKISWGIAGGDEYWELLRVLVSTRLVHFHCAVLSFLEVRWLSKHLCLHAVGTASGLGGCKTC
jgi:hypothetical protein